MRASRPGLLLNTRRTGSTCDPQTPTSGVTHSCDNESPTASDNISDLRMHNVFRCREHPDSETVTDGYFGIRGIFYCKPSDGPLHRFWARTGERA